MIETINAQQPTLFFGVPTLYAAMVAEMDQSGPPQAPLRLCISAGEALPEDVGRRWEAHTGVGILDGVGSTEMLHIFLSNAPGDIEYGTSGVAVPGYELRLVDETGAEVGTGEIGELLVNGQSGAAGYWNQRDKTRATFEGVWTRTGDKYERRADGRLVYCGRTDDMFKVSGIWVSPFEIEGALVSHPRVLEAAVVAARDAEGLEKPKAFVILQSGQADAALMDALKDHVKAKVGKWKYPRWIEVVEDLPKTATGKIQRFKLREGAE
jgi:4-hydroxybenzoate-CoA ligase